MRSGLVLVAVFVLGLAVGAVAERGAVAGSRPPVKVENLMRAGLEVSGELEVVMSLVEIGPGASLPKHYHPGEEFIYVLEGESTVWQEGKSDTVLSAGNAFHIELEQVHSAMTGSQSTKAIVFRVHRKGMPDRIPQ